MIRINLLGKIKVKAASKPKMRRGVPSQALQLVMLLGVIVLSVGGIYFWENALSQRDEELTKEINRAKKEKVRQENLLKENEVFEKRRKLLENRINIIEDLKNHQSGPVRILDTLSDCVQRTEGLWLQSLTQKDTVITLEGTVLGTPNVIADFITNLDQIGKFKNINLINATEENAKYTFSLTFEVPSAEPKAETKPNT